MAVTTININGQLQPQDTVGIDDSTKGTASFVWKGLYSNLLTSTASLEPGQRCPDSSSQWVVMSWQLQKINLAGTLTVKCVPIQEYTESSQSTPAEAKPLKDVWSIRSVRNDVNVMGYCGDSPGANPQRADIELWLKETDADLAAAYEYKAADGSVATLSNQSQALAAKLAKGVESVMRFYPVLTRKRTYQSEPPECLENLGYIDSPSTSSISPVNKKPGNLSTRLSEYQWLKCQDDCDENTDGTWTRTEAWMGIKITTAQPTPWDADLYGASRWDMPADLSGQGQGN